MDKEPHKNDEFELFSSEEKDDLQRNGRDRAGTLVIGGSVFIKVVLCWTTLCLVVLATRWKEIQMRADLFYADYFASTFQYKIDAVEEILYPGLKNSEEKKVEYSELGTPEVVLMKRLAIYSPVSGRERLDLLNKVIMLRTKMREEVLMTGSDVNKLIELEERSRLAYHLRDSRALEYFEASIEPMLYSPGDELQPGENPFIMYARLLAETGQFQKARKQIKEYRFALRRDNDPSKDECEKTLRYIDDLQKLQTQ